MQWGALAIASATCFIAAVISLWIFWEQRRSSEEVAHLRRDLDGMRANFQRSVERDEFMRWMLAQCIYLVQNLVEIQEIGEARASSAHQRTPRLIELKKDITRRIYELQVYSGDQRAIKNAAIQLIGVFPDHRTLEVLNIAAKAIDDTAMSEWLRQKGSALRRKLQPLPIIDPKLWTG